MAHDLDELKLHAGNILGLDMKGHVVHRLWIERSSDIAKEYYASFTLDRQNKTHLGMLSAQGGVEIEVVAEENPDAIAFLAIDPVRGLISRRRVGGSRTLNSMTSRASRPPNCSSTSTSATPRATVTSPRSIH